MHPLGILLMWDRSCFSYNGYGIIVEHERLFLNLMWFLLAFVNERIILGAIYIVPFFLLVREKMKKKLVILLLSSVSFTHSMHQPHQQLIDIENPNLHDATPAIKHFVRTKFPHSRASDKLVEDQIEQLSQRSPVDYQALAAAAQPGQPAADADVALEYQDQWSNKLTYLNGASAWEVDRVQKLKRCDKISCATLSVLHLVLGTGLTVGLSYLACANKGN